MDDVGIEITGESMKMIECPSCDFENAGQAPVCQKCAAPLFGHDPVCSMPTFGGESSGQVLDRRYVIVERIGADGAGVVYRAEDAETDIAVIIRALPRIIAEDPARIDEIRKKAKTLLDLSHANIEPLLGFQLDGPVKYFVCRDVGGTTLARKLSSSGPLTIAQAAAVFEALGEALDYTHSQNHLHGDINPANIILSADGSPKLVNFEITQWIKDSLSQANAEQADDAWLCFAPEQFRTGKPHQRSDIYSFAATMYQSLCRPPRVWRGWIEYQVLNETPAPLENLSDRQNAALLKALSRDARFRYRSTYKFLAELNLNSRASLVGSLHTPGARIVGLAERAINRMNAGIESQVQAKTEARVKTEVETRGKAEEKAAAGARAKAQAEGRARAVADEKARVEAEKLAAEARAKELAEKKAAEEARARAVAEEKARVEAEKLAAEARAREEAERKAAEEARARAAAEERARAEAERLAAETRAKRNAEKRVQEEARARAVAEEKTRVEAEKLAAEARAREQAERKAEEEARARAAAEERARAEAERLAAETRAKRNAEKRVQEEARARAVAEEKARVEAEKLAAEARAREQAERKAEEEARARAAAEERAQAEARARAVAEEKTRVEAEKLAAETRAKEKAEKRAVAEARGRAIAEEKTRIEAEKLAELETQVRLRNQAQAEERKQAMERQRIEAENRSRLEADMKKKAKADAKKAVKAKTKARKQAFKEAIAKAEKKVMDEAAGRAEAERKLAEQIQARSAVEEQAREYARELVLAQTAELNDEAAIDLDAHQLAPADITVHNQRENSASKWARVGKFVAAAAILVVAALAAVLYINQMKEPSEAIEAWTKAQLAASRQDYAEAIRSAEALIGEFPRYAEKHTIAQIQSSWRRALTTKEAGELWLQIERLVAQSDYDSAIAAAGRLLNQYPETSYAGKATASLPGWRSIAAVNKQVGDFIAKARIAQAANDFDAALAAATSALALDPENAAAGVLKAQAQAAKEAALRIEQMAAQKQGQFEALIKEAQLYQDAQDFERAIDIYTKASVLMPEDQGIADGLAFCRYSVHLTNARAAESTGDFDSAMESYASALTFANTAELKSSVESTIAAIKARRQGEETARLVQQWLSAAAEAEAAGDLDTAAAWYRKAADVNDPGATHKLALAYYNGNGVEQDIKKTLELLTKAADAGNSASMFQLGLIYHAGDGVEKDYAKALQWYKRAAEKMHPEAMHNLGAMYYGGEGTARNIAKGVEWLEKAAAAGNVQAMYNVAVAYYNGDGIAKDYTKAVEWFRKAADANDLGAMYNLALAYLDINDYANAKRWFEKVAATGNIEAMYNLGVMYYNGYGVNRDFGSAGEWYLKAAQGGETNAMVNLGLMHDEGLGTPKDADKAVQWYRKAADAGNPRGMANLAMAYYQGNGLEKNEKKAVEWLSKAAELGETMAMFNLALMHQEGRGAAKDLVKAAEWYKKAAEAGDPQAMVNLALMCQQGEGVPKDPEQAVLWLKKAADLGHPQAREELNKLNKTE